MKYLGYLTIAFVALCAVMMLFGVDGFTLQSGCKDYAIKKSREAVAQGYRPYDSYSFVGLGIGMCTPEYSNK